MVIIRKPTPLVFGATSGCDPIWI